MNMISKEDLMNIFEKILFLLIKNTKRIIIENFFLLTSLKN